MANYERHYEWPIHLSHSDQSTLELVSVPVIAYKVFSFKECFFGYLSCPIPLVKKLVLHKRKQWLFNPGKCSTSTRQQLTTWISCMFSSGNLHQCGRTLIQDILAESYYPIQVIKCFAKWPLRLFFWIFVSNFGGLSKMRRPVFT